LEAVYDIFGKARLPSVGSMYEIKLGLRRIILASAVHTKGASAPRMEDITWMRSECTHSALKMEEN